MNSFLKRRFDSRFFLSSTAPHMRAHKQIVAIASTGGHWHQLGKITEGLGDLPIIYISTQAGLCPPHPNAQVLLVPDCNRNEPMRVLACTARMIWMWPRLRPALVISTGALPGLVGIAIARLFGVQTLWIDSVANADVLSASGKLARRIAHTTVSQWEHVAAQEGVGFQGRIL